MIQEEVRFLITVLNLTLMIQEEVKSLILVITVLPQTLMIQEEVSHKLHNNQEVNQQQLVDTFNWQLRLQISYKIREMPWANKIL